MRRRLGTSFQYSVAPSEGMRTLVDGNGLNDPSNQCPRDATVDVRHVVVGPYGKAIRSGNTRHPSELVVLE